MNSEELFSKTAEAIAIEQKIIKCEAIIANSDDRFITAAINFTRQLKLENYKRKLEQLNTEIHRSVFGF